MMDSIDMTKEFLIFSLWFPRLKDDDPVMGIKLEIGNGCDDALCDVLILVWENKEFAKA